MSDPDWLIWAREIQATAQTGLAFCKDPYDIERYHALRALAAARCESAGIQLRVPRPGLCTDNGAMVAALGASVVAAGRPPSSLGLPADSSLPITEVVVP